MSTASVSRRFVLLSGLHWFPVGLVVPILVLSFQARGLDLASVGRLMALYGAVTLLLELPTGGLSDVVGRRPVLVAGSLASASGAVALAFSPQVVGLAAGVVLLAVGRALSSGPLESWFVDTVRDHDADADISRGLAHAQAADGVALGVGSLIGGALPTVAASLWPTLSTTGDAVLTSFSVSLLASAALFALHAVGVLLLVREPGRQRVVGISGAVVGTLREGILLARSSTALRRLLGYTAVLGMTLGGVELVAPGAFATMLGGGEEGSAAYGVLVGLGFGVSAVGAVVAPRVAARLGSSRRAAAWLGLLAVPAVLLIGLPWFGAAALAYLALYLVLGVNGPLLATLVHDEVSSSARNTVLSLDSLLLQAGGIVASLAVGALVGATGPAAGFAAMAAVAAAGALLLWGLRTSGRAEPASDESPVGGLP